MSVKKRATLLFFSSVISIVLVFIFNHYVNIHIAGHFEGFYLLRLKNGDGKKYQFSDHLFVGREKEIVYAVDLQHGYFGLVRKLLVRRQEESNHLHVEWNPRDGNGMVSSYFAGGTKLVTYLGRYLDDEQEVHGIFVGGGLPATVESNVSYNMNNSGMTYFDGKRWYHIWCSVNEGIGSAVSGAILTPSKWEFLGSGVEKRGSDNVVINSSHKAVLDGTPLRIDRRASFTAGETYFNLEIKITNLGERPLVYNYLYGDEPWIGYYGTSLGDVGWVKERLVNHEEIMDTRKYSFIGMADLGNSVIGERPVYTNLANFIEWFGEEQPKFAYFTNDMNQMPRPDKKNPLESNERFLGIAWERWLKPSGTATIRLAVGMAMLDPKTGIPEKPLTHWK